MGGSRKNSTERETRAEQARRLAEGSFKWTRIGAVLAALAIIAAVAIAVAANSSGSKNELSSPVGVVVNTVPHDSIGGAAIYPVPGGRPSDFLPGGVSLYVECVHALRGKYAMARISDDPYKNHWIDVFDIKTPEGRDVRFLEPPLHAC